MTKKENITIELYYLKDKQGNTIIDREYMIKEMDKEIEKLVEAAIVELPICYKCGKETDIINEALYCPRCELEDCQKLNKKTKYREL